MNNDKMMDAAAAARFLGLKVATVRNYASLGKLPSYKSPTGRIYYSRQDLFGWMRHERRKDAAV